MRISIEKNLVFARQPKPILADDIRRLVKPRPAAKELEDTVLDIGRFVRTAGAPRIAAELGADKRPTLRIKNFAVGQHAFPPSIPVKGIKSLGKKSRTFARPLLAEAHRPDHLALQPLPQALPRSLQVQPYFQGVKPDTDRKFGNQATTVFPPENRRVFADTRYPWSTCGRADSPLGQGSGAMVGPRHLLTVSHLIQWNSDGTAGWVRFRPAFFAPSEPFGDAWAVRTYFKYKVQGPTIDFVEGMFDYVVCVLNRRIGDWTGWLGGKGYTDGWDGGAYWSHVGYPGDLTSGNRPTFQGGISLDGVWWEPDSHEAMSHLGDVWPGQSGGPFFGWWGGWPYAVAVQSSQNSSENNASGGQDLVDLILRARSDYP
jgi:V8-like Glu-specific endopeptidase